MSISPPAALSRPDRFAILAILIAGSFGGAFIAGTGIITGLFRLLDPAGYPIQLLADIPVETGPGIVQAHGDSLIVNAEQLSAGPLWLLALSELALSLTIACVTTSFAYVLYRVVQHKPFHRTMQAAALVAGFAIAIGSLL